MIPTDGPSCPRCSSDSKPLNSVSRSAWVSYFACETCGHVWHTERAEDASLDDAKAGRASADPHLCPNEARRLLEHEIKRLTHGSVPELVDIDWNIRVLILNLGPEDLREYLSRTDDGAMTRVDCLQVLADIYSREALTQA